MTDSTENTLGVQFTFIITCFAQVYIKTAQNAMTQKGSSGIQGMDSDLVERNDISKELKADLSAWLRNCIA